MLSALIWIPVLGALGLALWPGQISSAQARQFALMVATAALGVTAVLLVQFDPLVVTSQMAEYIPWLDPIGLHYQLGLDGLSLPLIVLNSFLIWITIYSTDPNMQRSRLYYGLILVISAGVAGAFLAENLLLFFLFYEVELIPLFLLIAIWGGPRREYAATKFLLYTAFSGVLMLGAFLAIAFISGSPNFTYSDLRQADFSLAAQMFLLITLLIAFGIKTPLVPFHTWLPDAHVEASTPVSVLLAGVLLKLGTYGMLRFGLGLFPEAWVQIAPWLAVWAVISVLYGSFMAIAQRDIKKMVAYSSVGHMGYILLALAAATPLSLVGAVAQMICHGLISALLFLLVGVVYKKTGTRDLEVLQGLLAPERGMPLIGSLMVLGVMASAGTPGMAGFVAEFIIFHSSFMIFPVQTILCMLGTGLTAVYFLLLVNRAFFGRLTERLANMPPVNWPDRIPALIVAAFIVYFGVQPNALLRWSEQAMAHLVQTSPALTALATSEVP